MKVRNTRIQDRGPGRPSRRSLAGRSWYNSAATRLGKGVCDAKEKLLGLAAEILETAITWDRWPALDQAGAGGAQAALNRVCGGGPVTCRFTPGYPYGPAPYFTFEGVGRRGADLQIHAEIKQATSDAVMAAGGGITYHHAVGKVHRPWYDQQRPEPFAEALRAAKPAVDPNWVLNPGALIDPVDGVWEKREWTRRFCGDYR